ncbi:nicotinate phosphoribosyltransferase [Alkalinema sp. FACHB-956]|uniref:nicotinate phosphoribosyltransferase n=1 Tax=Alkalinema sp. FACHB-956 TaxID=2692768 RepID=UPI0016871698|nr:nicotinate phosphoribosyltransferase [Alkalinema sp. FACHB-956]MBD2327545.1 nicotinate phosphoribosyltransferase [Alkalinema sp. FACHB-956]
MPVLEMRSEDTSLLTDLYQLTMAACYVGEGLDQRTASFELFVRRLPAGFGYLIAMGLEEALAYLESLQFTPQHIAALQQTGIFDHAPDRFWQLLESAKFTGEIWAVPEGTAVFANEPLLRVEAPLWQAQLVETYLLNVINYQTLIASRSTRIRDAAGPEAHLLEFGTRRAFSPQAALWAARAAIAAGFDATSNVLAAMKMGQKPVGTMAHALVMALGAIEGSEQEAFSAFHRYFPNAPLLIDTYDVIHAAEALRDRIANHDISLSGVRIDSGDLVTLSQKVRELLPTVNIFASGDLDEFRITELQAAGACIDGYGIGTQLVTGAPVNGVYKLVDIDGIPVMKESAGKMTYPGRKQIFRSYEHGLIHHDRLGLITEAPLSGEVPLLQPVMKQGERLQPVKSLAEIAETTARSMTSLPPEVRQIQQPSPVIPQLSEALQHLLSQTQNRLQATHASPA